MICRHCWLTGVISLLVVWSLNLNGQTNISGIINQYSTVSSVNYPANAVTVADPALFVVGDQVLLIQMQGATIDETNTSSFGNVSSIGGAGSYELATVCDVSGNTLTLENSLVNADYNPAGKLQVVTVPEYSDARVTAELTGEAWNGFSGGVLALSVTNELILDAPILMNGKGFRGGDFENATSNCSFISEVDDYFYSTPNDGGGKKGESIAEYVNNKEYGRGPQASGGGGGNDHNSGGGGGANAGAGGAGGNNISTSFLNCDGEYPGTGGNVPLLSSNRIFLGGGGGAGEGNNGVGTSGGHGGGIVLIFTNTLRVSTSALITSNGLAAANTIGGDGAGGGGAGGSIYLEANAVIGTPILSVAGGKGGDVDNGGNSRCFGPGGGGGGGLIRTNVSPSIVTVVDGGMAGESRNSSFAACTGFTGSSTGGTGVVTNETVPSGTVLSPICLSLPVTWQEVFLDLEPKVTKVIWSVSEQESNDFFSVERSQDGRNYEELARVSATASLSYYFTDRTPLNGYSFYRIRQTDFDGTSSFSPMVSSYRNHPEVRLFPSPANPGEIINLVIPEASRAGLVSLRIVDQNGRDLRRQLMLNETGGTITTHDLPPGLYFVNILNERINWTGKLLIGR
jgi:hypothetical protein